MENSSANMKKKEEKLKPSFSSNHAVQYLLGFITFVSLGAALFSPILAVYIVDFIPKATVATVGFATALYAVVKVLVQVPLSRWMDRNKGEMDDFFVMVAGSLLTTLYFFGFVMINTVEDFYLISMIGGVGVACVFGAYYGIFSRHVDGGSEGFEWSMFSSIGMTLPIALGGAAGGILADMYGFQVIFMIAGFLAAIASIFLVLLYPYLYRPAINPRKHPKRR